MQIHNDGPIAGAEVVQLYIAADPTISTIARPKKELKGFRKVFLEPGEAKQVEIDLDKHAVAFWDEVLKCWVCEQGRYEVLVGSSSADIRLKGELVLEETWTWTGL
jgi:beta-glucosidase